MNTKLISGKTNGLYQEFPAASIKGIAFDLSWSETGETQHDPRVPSGGNSKGNPNKLIIQVNGGKPKDIGLLDMLPDGSMSVEAALLLWGKHQPEPAKGKCREVLGLIATLRAQELANF